MAPKKKGLSREEAAQLYRDLHRAVTTLKGQKATQVMEEVKKRKEMIKNPTQMLRNIETSDSLKVDDDNLIQSVAGKIISEKINKNGQYGAIACVVFFAAIKVVLSGLEVSGIFGVTPAQAAYAGKASIESAMLLPVQNQITNAPGVFSKEELSVLTSLDNRRVELEERSKRMDERDEDLQKRDREYTTKMAKLKELTEMLRSERENDDMKKNTQIEQLSNVYGSMNPPEAATLLEQLDVTIALSLLEKMPEKRIGQILSLMNPEKALTITKLLSGRMELGKE